MIFTATFLVSCVKLLFIPSYRSTDFEVHRNWLAITHSLPLKQWYFENTSEWTLDYPPLFAWFEYLLSYIAIFFDKEMLVVENLNHASPNTIAFQRLSVIFTDFVYTYGVYRCSKCLQKSWKNDVVLPILMITNCGLLIVDHIHFQYNGIMYGILLISIAYMMQGKPLWSAFWFTVLLNMKHIFIYMAPAYFVYLLRFYCIRGPLNYKNLVDKHFFRRLTLLGSIVISIFLITFLPFRDHIGQVLSRLFPFKRGLVHAYWAPNIWAIYNSVDKFLYLLLQKLGLMHKQANLSASMTGGLVQEYNHIVLPNITPLTTMVLTAIVMLPLLVKMCTVNKHIANFLRCMVLCALTSFMFGWHVHEKAILMAIIPFSILAVMEPEDGKLFLILSTTGHYSLFPLLFPNSLTIIKALLLVLYSMYAFHSLSKIYPLRICKYTLPLLNPFESMYLVGLCVLFVFEHVLYPVTGLANTFPFVPLLLTSVYCSCGVIYSWFSYYMYFLLRDCDYVNVNNDGNKNS